jgi:hypothetical protein
VSIKAIGCRLDHPGQGLTARTALAEHIGHHGAHPALGAGRLHHRHLVLVIPREVVDGHHRGHPEGLGRVEVGVQVGHATAHGLGVEVLDLGQLFAAVHLEGPHRGHDDHRRR